MYVKALFLALLFGLSTPLATPASAASLLWTFDNEINQNISIEFYSQDRNHVWPGNDQVYVIGPSDGARTYNLDCQQNELICYGGWVRSNKSTFWGSGRNDSQQCDTCCARCGQGSVEPVNLIR